MSREVVHTICRSLPGARNSDPTGVGRDAWKVAGVVFAVLTDEGVVLRAGDEAAAAEAVARGLADPAPYFNRLWTLWSYRTPEPVLRAALATSHRAIVAALPERTRMRLEDQAD